MLPVSLRGSPRERPRAKGAGDVEDPPQLLSKLRMLGLTVFSFPYGMVCAVSGVFLFPMEAMRLWAGEEGVLLGEITFFARLNLKKTNVCPST